MGIHSEVFQASSGLKLTLIGGGANQGRGSILADLTYVEDKIHKDNLAIDIQPGENYSFLLRAASSTDPADVGTLWIEWFYKYV